MPRLANRQIPLYIAGVAVGAMLIVWLLLQLAHHWRPAQVLTVRLTGGSSACCGWSKTMESYRLRDRDYETFEQRKSQSRLVRTDSLGLQLWELPEGSKFWVPERGAFHIGSQVRWHPIEGQSEPPINQGDVVIDCGGSLGASTQKALGLGASLVVTVEPDPENLICLKRNLAGDIEAGRVIVYEKGVWDREDELFLQRHGHAGDATVDLESGIPVELTTVDKIVSELDLQRVDFIKMDIEGSEQRALQGAQETIRRFKPRMAIASYHLVDDNDQIPEIVARARTDYQIEYTRCLLLTHGTIGPHLLYFH